MQGALGPGRLRNGEKQRLERKEKRRVERGDKGVRDKKGRPKLIHWEKRRKENITEYIDFIYSLHHLYKYIEPKKDQYSSEKKNSAIQKPTTAVRQTESEREEKKRARERERNGGSSMRHGQEESGSERQSAERKTVGAHDLCI